MQDLRLIGIHEDGAHLLLAGPDGARFRLPVDDALRGAARRERPRQGQLGIQIDGDVRPRDVQTMIRAGMDAQEVAERTGWTVDKVHKYEGPILAEREHVAGLAQQVRLRPRGSASGRAPTLATRVVERLAGRGVEGDLVGWDSWRSDGGGWVVGVSFPAGGRQRQATWTFDPATRVIAARDDEARWLAEDEPEAGVVTTAARAAAVYDVDADGGVEGAGRPTLPTHLPDDAELVSSVREHSTVRARRGGARRRHTEPALPLEEAFLAGESSAPASALSGPAGVAAGPNATPPLDSPSAPESHRSPAGDDAPTAQSQPAEVDPATEAPEPRPGGGSAPAPAPAPSRRGARTPVPSWEDIVFGAKSPAADPG